MIQRQATTAPNVDTSAAAHGERETVTPWSGRSLRVLYLLGPRSPRGWLATALAQSTDDPPELVEVPSLLTGLERLRHEAFDVILLERDVSDLAPRALLETLRATTFAAQAVVVLDNEHRSEAAAEFWRAGACGYLSFRTATPAELLGQLRFAAMNGRLQADHRVLSQWRERHAQTEQAEANAWRTEAAHLLQTSRSSVATSEVEPMRSTNTSQSAGATPRESSAAAAWRSDLRELLPAYVVMGGGDMQREVARCALNLSQSTLTDDTWIRIYTEELTALLDRRGLRSFRQIQSRSHLLLIDLLLARADANACPFDTTEPPPHTRANRRPAYDTISATVPWSSDEPTQSVSQPLSAFPFPRPPAT